MKKELDEALCAKYPRIFRDRHSDMMTTCMCWGFDCGDGWYNLLDCLCGTIQGHINGRRRNIDATIKSNSLIADCKAGYWTDFDKKYSEGEWYAKHPEYVEKQREDILKMEPREVEKEIEQVVATQVKEKFGGLRFYYSGGGSAIDDYIRGAVSLAEHLSERTCELCGAPGVCNKEGWIACRCPEHT